MPLHLVGISDNKVWHTIRNANFTWAPWDEFTITGHLSHPVPGSPQQIACAIVLDTLHVCVLTTTGLFHTIRFARGDWQPWGDAGTVFPQLGIDHVGCVGIGTGLHMCVTGRRQGVPLSHPVPLPTVWRAVRISDSTDRTRDFWEVNPNTQQLADQLTNLYSSIDDVACANVNGNELHILARCKDQSYSEKLMHNIWFSRVDSQPLGDQDVFSIFANTLTASDLPGTHFVAAAGIGPALHIIASDGTELFQTIRLNNDGWLPTFGPIRYLTGPSVFPGPLSKPACANESGNLHVCAISNGSIMHTIFIPNLGFRNPETASSGPFGDVLGVVPPTPSGVTPPRSFQSIACVGSIT